MTPMTVLASASLVLVTAACGGNAPRPRDVAQTEPTSAKLPARADNATGSERLLSRAPDPKSATHEVTTQGQSDADLTTTAFIRRNVVGDTGLAATSKNIMIITNLGKVTLRGTVKSATDRIAIENHARKAPQMIEIDNLLEVAPTK